MLGEKDSWSISLMLYFIKYFKNLQSFCKKDKKSDHGSHQHKLLGWIFFLPQMSNLDFYNASDSISVSPPCLHLSFDEVMLGMIGPSSQIKPRSPPHFYSPGIHYAKRAVVSDGIFYFIITNRRVNN